MYGLHITFMPEVAAERQRWIDERAAQGLESHIDPVWQNLYADEIRVEGGAVILILDGRIEHIVGPTAYQSINALWAGTEAEDGDEDEGDENEYFSEQELSAMNHEELIELAEEYDVHLPEPLRKKTDANHKRIVEILLDDEE